MSQFIKQIELLEPYDAKVSRTVLRGERGSNASDLPDNVAKNATARHHRGSAAVAECGAEIHDRGNHSTKSHCRFLQRATESPKAML